MIRYDTITITKTEMWSRVPKRAIDGEYSVNAKATGFPCVRNLQRKLDGPNKATGVQQLLIPHDRRRPLEFQGVPENRAPGFAVVGEEEFLWSSDRG